MTSIVLHTVWLSIAALCWIVALISLRKEIYNDVFHPQKPRNIDDALSYVGAILALGPGLILTCLCWPLLFPLGAIYGAFILWDKRAKPYLNDKFFPQADPVAEKTATVNIKEEPAPPMVNKYAIDLGEEAPKEGKQEPES